MNPVWQRLSLFESRDILASRFSDRHGRHLGPAKAREISSHVAQARQYYESSFQANSLTRPLLLYYGCLSLARGLALFASPNLRETSLSPGHGLRADWTRVLNTGAKLEELQIKISNAGTFQELQNATGPRERVRVISVPFPNQAWATESGSGTATWGRHVRFGDVISRIPSALEVYQESLGEEAHCFPATQSTLAHGTPQEQTDVIILPSAIGLPTDTHIREELVLPEQVVIRSSSQFFSIVCQHLSFRIQRHPSHPDFHAYESPLMRLDPVEQSSPYIIHPFYVASLINGDLKFTTVELLYLTAFALGTLVRYHPTYLATIRSHGLGDKYSPIIQHLTDIVEAEFPARTLAHFSIG